MPLLNDIFLVVGLLILFSASVISTETAPCIENYHDLKTSVVNNSENAQNLLTTFYPPNRSPAHILIVYYYLANVYQEDNTDNITGNETHPHFENPNITADHIFQWMDSSTLLLTEFRLFKALTFGIAGLESGELEIKVDKPFCNSDDEVKLLNLATIWLKTFTVHDKQTEYYFSMYFNDEKFIVLGNSVRDSTFALVLCEYFACVGALVVIYTVLVLCKYETFAPFRKTLSDISIPCLVFSIAILIKDIYSYSVSFQYVSTEWYRAFPIPIVVPLFAIFNTFISIIITIIIGPNFQIPLMLSSLASVLCLKGKFYNSIMQVILIFSIALFAVLATFHFTWVILAFSSYPVRCLASQAFTVPLILIVIIVYTIINYVLSSPTIVLEIKKKSKRIAVTLISIFLMVPFLIALMGILYYYSQVLIDVNDSQNYPIKTIIAGLVPTVVTTLGALVLRNTLKAFNTMMNEKTEIKNSNLAEKNPTHSHNMVQLQVAEGEQETLQRKKNFDDKDSDEEMLPMVEFDQ